MLEKGFFFRLFLLSRTFLALLHSPFVSYVAFVEVKDTYLVAEDKGNYILIRFSAKLGTWESRVIPKKPQKFELYRYPTRKYPWNSDTNRTQPIPKFCFGFGYYPWVPEFWVPNPHSICDQIPTRAMCV